MTVNITEDVHSSLLAMSALLAHDATHACDRVHSQHAGANKLMEAADSLQQLHHLE